MKSPDAPVPLPRGFLDRPIAHRGRHGPGVPENSLAAARAAIAAGYGIELDIQPAHDGTPMVFHDYDLRRLTGDARFIAVQTPDALAALRLSGTDEPIPTLADFLTLVAGQVPLLIEIKEPIPGLSDHTERLAERVAGALDGYAGEVAVMSFDPAVVAAFHRAAPHLPCGLTTCDYARDDWPLLDDATRVRRAAIPDYDAVGASFISHNKRDLANPRVAELRRQGAGVLCWTIRSPEEEAAARLVAHNITFEGYRP